MNNPQSLLPPQKAGCKATLSPQEAAKLIKFYLNLYPDLVGTLKDYFPKQITKKQTTFNRTIKVAIPKNIKSSFAARLVKELAFTNWFFQGYYLMVPYHSEAEYQRLTRDITKLAKEFGVKGLSFRGIKGVIPEQKAAKKRDSCKALSDKKNLKALPTNQKKVAKENPNSAAIKRNEFIIDTIYRLAKEYGYSSDYLISQLGTDYTSIILGTKKLTNEDISKVAKVFNLPESVFYPEERAA